jgi:hypothetical protein
LAVSAAFSDEPPQQLLDHSQDAPAVAGVNRRGIRTPFSG